LHAAGAKATVVGSFVVTPDAEQIVPSVARCLCVRIKRNNGFYNGFRSNPAAEFLIYTDMAGAIGAIGSVQTGVAISNPSGETVEIDYDLVGLDGSPSGVARKKVGDIKGRAAQDLLNDSALRGVLVRPEASRRERVRLLVHELRRAHMPVAQYLRALPRLIVHFAHWIRL
jgi:hypothetical protein